MVEFKLYGATAKEINDGDIFIAKEESVEGRKVISFTIAVPKIGCSECKQWFYETDEALESRKSLHEAELHPNEILQGVKIQWRRFY